MTEKQEVRQAAQQQIQAAPRQEQVLQEAQANEALVAQTVPEWNDVTVYHMWEANETLLTEAGQEMVMAGATRTAEGTPVQEQEPAPSTWKKRREERKKAEAARKACPVGTAATYDMVEQLKEQKKTIENSLNSYLGQADVQAGNMKCLRAYCQGYRTNRFGFPASQEDKRKKKENEQFLKDYSTGESWLRRPHLDRIVEEIIHIPFSLDMFTPHNLRHNLAKLKYWGECLTHIQDLKAENQEYFEELREGTRGNMIDAADAVGAAFVPLLMAHCKINGVDANAADYFGGTIREEQTNLELLTENFQRALMEYRKKGVYESYSVALGSITSSFSQEEMGQIAMGPVEHQRQTDQTFERLKEDPRLGLSPEELASETVTRAKAVLVPDEAHAKENIRTIRLMRDLGQNGDQKPPADLYARTREFVAPIVQRIFDTPVQQLDWTRIDLIREHSGELEKLAREAELAADLLKLQHPIREARYHGRLMLQDELLGSREYEYIYKSAMVTALAKKARMLSLLAKGEMGDENIKEECLTEKERREAGNVPELWVNQKLQEAEKEIGRAETKYENAHVLGTREFANWIENIIDRGKLDREAVDMKYEPVISEFEKEETPEIQQVMKRLREKNYYSIECTNEQRKALGMPENIGEGLFRSFGAFLKKEAAKKLLSPEEFRQMLLDLGAGAGMHGDAWEGIEQERKVDENGEVYYESKTVLHPATPKEELEPAIQRNKAGLAVYKRILEAQYDMITRKYGSSLEWLGTQKASYDWLEEYEILPMEDVTPLVRYCNDILRDFGDSQVEGNMAFRFPGLLNLDDEKDKLLYYRIKYYSIVGKRAEDLYTFMDSRLESPGLHTIRSLGDIKQYMQDALNDPEVVEARDYLSKHDDKFEERWSIDPSQTVQAPEQAQ